MKRQLPQAGACKKRARTAKDIFRKHKKKEPRARVLPIQVDLRPGTESDILRLMVHDPHKYQKAKAAFLAKQHAFSPLPQQPVPRAAPDRAYTCRECTKTAFVSVEGSTVCSNCGFVVSCRDRYDGQAQRNFASDSADERHRKNHHGVAYDRRFSMGHNLTSIQGKTTSNVPEWARKKKHVRPMEAAGTTTDEFRDRAKRKAFAMIDHVCDAARLPHGVKRRAEVLYAQHRNLVEREHDTEMVITVCIVHALNKK